MSAHAHGDLKRRVCFLISFHALTLLEEVLPVLRRPQELDPLGELERLRLFLTSTPSPEAQERRVQQGHRYGDQNAPRLPKGMMAETLAPNREQVGGIGNNDNDNDKENDKESGVVGVFVSGPERGMNRAVEYTRAARGRHPLRHAGEEFEL
ncbi:hypothetical protein P43SY_011155 [Pythium insidiosum]|uniref:Uncharacterized protein n=1 Tax=Pythium insidiosum TaxID=114742 RepID=A0AAD5LS25_PYTIN|nr:hypothetical protein P43SY_011155 [Pythium insidiosum]